VDTFDRLLADNRRYAPAHETIDDARPRRRLAVITCMDARIDVLTALGLGLGDAHVIRNAGGRVTDDVLRSLALSSHALGVDTVAVVEHTGCGLTGTSDAALRHLTGADVEFLAIDDHAATIRRDVALIASTPYLGAIASVAGFLFDVTTGTLDEVVRRGLPPP
jgi:carbonic anhydrase